MIKNTTESEVIQMMLMYNVTTILKSIYNDEYYRQVFLKKCLYKH